MSFVFFITAMRLTALDNRSVRIISPNLSSVLHMSTFLLQAWLVMFKHYQCSCYVHQQRPSAGSSRQEFKENEGGTDIERPTTPSLT
eukprot:2124975-Amphidinium_carterae.1